MSNSTSVLGSRSNLELFDFKGHRVRVILAEDGEPRWVASDVAKVLGYASAKDMTRNLRERNKGRQNVPTPGGQQEMTTITEAGLYQAVLKSRRAEAEAFQDWVTDEVLPAIRRHGGYLTPEATEAALSDPDFIIRLATNLKEERARREALEAPAASWEALAAPGGDFSVTEAAKVLSRTPGIEIGRDRLFKYMASLGWIYRTQGKRSHWEAYQDKGIKTGRLAHKMGARFINEKTGQWEQAHPTIRVTAKGIHELRVHLTEVLEASA